MAQDPKPEALSRDIRQCAQTIFPTPLFVHAWPDSEAMNRALTEMILAEEAADAGLARSNVGGWHSPMGFVLRRDPPIPQLMQRIQVFVGEVTKAMMKPGRYRFSVDGWANVLRKGGYNTVHVHPNSTWSGVYYVTGNPPPADGEGSPDHSGKIEFLDPRPGASAAYTVDNVMQRQTMLNPDPGTMILFPSWLQHQVHPYFGPEVRISIAFNVLVQ